MLEGELVGSGEFVELVADDYFLVDWKRGRREGLLAKRSRVEREEEKRGEETNLLDSSSRVDHDSESRRDVVLEVDTGGLVERDDSEERDEELNG